MTGTIDISQLNTPPEPHEFETVKFFSELGKNIVFIRPSSIPNVHRPDILMDGIEWEIKCPEGRKNRTIETNVRTAMKQSQNIIFDLRYIKVSEKQSISQLEYYFKTKPRIRRLMVIKKNLELLEFSKV